MKLAVFFSGQLRTGLHAFPNIARFFGNNLSNIDFYIHVWDVNTYKPYWNIKFSEPPEKISQVDLEKYIAIYRPKKYKIEKYDPHANYHTENYRPLHYSFAESIKLIDSEYDAVIKMRPDMIFPPRIKLSNFLDDFNSDKDSFYSDIYVNDNINDVIWIASQKNMKIASAYNNGKIMIAKYLTNNNIKIKAFSSPSYTCLRPEALHLNPMAQYKECFKVDILLYSPAAHQKNRTWEHG